MAGPERRDRTAGSGPRLTEVGDGALLVEFGDAIDPELNRAVIALDAALSARPIPGLLEMVPTYRSLLIQFDPLVLPRSELRALVDAALAASAHAPASGRIFRVPVLYGGEHGADLESVAARHGLDPEAVVALHAGAEYRVYMIGFAPGFAYLGGLPERIHTDRRPDPRMKTPPSSVSIGGKQAGISPPFALPSGWHLLGRTPVKTYDPARVDRPFLFEPGDGIRFFPVSAAEYHDMVRAAEAGHLVAEAVR